MRISAERLPRPSVSNDNVCNWARPGPPGLGLVDSQRMGGTVLARGGLDPGKVDFDFVDFRKQRQLGGVDARRFDGGADLFQDFVALVLELFRRGARILEEVDIVADEFRQRLAEDAGVVDPFAHVGPVGLLAPAGPVGEHPAEQSRHEEPEEDQRRETGRVPPHGNRWK